MSVGKLFRITSFPRRRFLKWVGAVGGAALFPPVMVRDRAKRTSLKTRQDATTVTPSVSPASPDVLPLPEPDMRGTVSLEEALANRRSVRSFSEHPLSWEAISQLLWAAQGITDPTGKRTAPSAGALYPLELYLAVAEGLYQYRPADHVLLVRGKEDLRPALYAAALRQDAVLHAPGVFLVTAVYARTAGKYGEVRAPRYVHLEAGHATQNMLLQAVALGLAGVPIGAFYDEQVQEALGLPEDHAPLYLVPIGPPAA